MAVMKIWNVHGRLEHSLEYVKNPEKTVNPEFTKKDLDSLRDVMEYAVNSEKTEKQFFVSGVNCNPATAREQFITVKKQFGKEDGIIAYHGYQSFAEGEVTPEQAHQIGVEFAKRVWGDAFQVIIATHLNTHCFHNHFVVNSVSFKHGKRCREKQWRELSRISDEICREHGLSVVEHPKGKGLPYPLYEAERQGKPTRLNMAKEAIDTAISQSCNMHEFEQILKGMGYICQFNYNRKYWTIRQTDWKKPLRITHLGPDYTNDRIKARVAENPISVRGKRMEQLHRKKNDYKLPTREDKIKNLTGLQKLYMHYCYKLGYFPKYQQSRKKVYFLYRDDLIKMDQISAQARMLVRENISTKGDLEAYEEKTSSKIAMLVEQRNVLHKKLRSNQFSEEEKEHYRSQVEGINSALKALRKELRLCKGIEERSKVIAEKMEHEKLQQLDRKERKRV